jgi:hypothetical protein
VAFLLFIDESGQDRHDSPYEVLAGVAVEDSRTWNLITAIQGAEVEHFGQRISMGQLELKAKKILKKKTFRLAAQMPDIQAPDRLRLTMECLAEGIAATKEGRSGKPTRAQLTALGQSKIAFAKAVLTICAQHGVKAFASIVDDGPRPSGSFLRKDYSYLFERFYYFLEEQHPYHQGIVIFDELEKSKSHILVDQMCHYFQDTASGKMRAARIIPEPMFVHSDLTSLVQVADIVAYVISWAVRTNEQMSKPIRQELAPFARLVGALRHRTRQRHRSTGQTITVSSFKFIDDLRSHSERHSRPPPSSVPRMRTQNKKAMHR